MRNLSPQNTTATVRLLLEGYHGKLTLLQNASQGPFCTEGGHVRQLVSPYLFHHHSELALCAQNRLHTREPLHTGEDFRRPDEDLPRIKAIWIIKEKTLWGKGRGKRQHKVLLLLRFKIPAFLFSHSWSVWLTITEKSRSCPSLKAHSPPEVSPAVPIATHSVTHVWDYDSVGGKQRYLEETKDVDFHTNVLSNKVAMVGWVPGKDTHLFSML